MSSPTEMRTYAIRRKNAWASPAEVEQVAARSKQVADEEFPTDVCWIRSYVIAEEDGTLGSVCIYQAASPEAIREHAPAAGGNFSVALHPLRGHLRRSPRDRGVLW